MTAPLKDFKCCATMRHETSLNAVFGFVSGLGGSVSGFRAIVMDRSTQTADVYEAAHESLMTSVRGKLADAYVLASKVNDALGAGLTVLLDDMKREGLGDVPVVVTFLGKVSDEQKKDLQATGVSLMLIEDDNLGFPKGGDAPGTQRTGMSKLGPALLALRG